MIELEALISTLLALVVGIGILSALSWGLLRIVPGNASSVRFLLLAGPVLIPLMWTIGASFHELEPGHCLWHPGHHPGDVRFHVLLLVVALAVPVVAAIGHQVARAWREGGARIRVDAGHPAMERLEEILVVNPELNDIRIRVLDRDGCALRTDGLLRPRVEMGADLVLALSREDLAAALFHEREHVRGRDPLRRLLLAVSLWLNPFRAILVREAGAWRFQREIACDRNAVVAGADALRLASALVRVARPRAVQPRMLALAPGLAHDALERLRLRVELLLAYAVRKPSPVGGRWDGMLLPSLILALLALPHVVDAWPLVGLYEDFHQAHPQCCENQGGPEFFDPLQP